MALFLRQKNKYYSLMYEILGEMYRENGEMSGKQLKMLLQEGRPYGLQWLDNVFIDGGEYPLVYKSKDNPEQYNMSLDAHVPIRFMNMEKLWLHAILSDPHLQLFLSQETIDKLKEVLKEYNENNMLRHIHTIPAAGEQTSDINKEYSDKINLIRKAIHKRQAIRYIHLKAGGRVFQSFPVRFEYSIKHRILYVILYALEEDRVIKSKVCDLLDICIIKQDEVLDVETFANKIELMQRKEPIVLQVKDVKNALERACYLFSPFLKKVNKSPRQGVFEITIHYYRFEESEILSRIFSLGRAVIVKEPLRIQEIVKKRIKLLLHRSFK